MKQSKRKRFFIIGVLSISLLSLFLVTPIFSYNGYLQTKNECIENNKTIEEDQVGLLGLSWSITCKEK